MMPVRTSFDFAAAVFGPRWVCVRLCYRLLIV